jgi:2-polyprenyl-3-methyl-5-hydroxy-6-metoxy-1,4-benzoquinol methylase
MLDKIIKNYKDNKQHIYEEPPIDIYDEQYYKTQCGGFELFNCSQGTELDDLREYALNLCPLLVNYVALDIGCGRGELVFTLAQLGLHRVVGIDLSQDSVDISCQTCEQQIKNGQTIIQKMSATDLEFNDTTFDIVYMTDIVEHLSDLNLKKAICEAHRVLKPGGRLIIHTLPTVNFKLYGQYITKLFFQLKGLEWATYTTREEVKFGHVNIQSKESLKSYLSQSFLQKNIRVFYAPVNSNSILKKLVAFLGLWTIMSPHLWAVARK